MSTTSPYSVRATVALASVATAALIALHLTDPQLDPSWRMISEYADGRVPWLLSAFFAMWGAASWTTAWTLWPRAVSRRRKIGTILIALSGIGEAMAAIYDIHHPLHGAAFAIGVPSLALGAMLIGGSVAAPARRRRLLMVAQLPWISVILMALSFALLMKSAGAAGVVLKPGEPWHTIPTGVIAVMGWANRFLVLCYLLFLVVAARSAIDE